MQVSTETIDGVLVVCTEGRIDTTNAADFERAVDSAADRHVGAPVVLDYEHVHYMSSAGLHALLSIAQRAFEREELFAICSLSAPIADTLRISGLDRLIESFASRDEALAAIRG